MSKMRKIYLKKKKKGENKKKYKKLKNSHKKNKTFDMKKRITCHSMGQM